MINFNLPEQLSLMEKEIVADLRLVIDPELHLNIVDLGLVYEVKITDPDKHLNIIMTLSSRYCPMGESIVSAVKNCMELHFPNFKTTVQLTWEPAWSFNNISDEGRRLLDI